MKLTPQQIRSPQLGLIVQAALKSVATEDPTILAEISSNSIDLSITMNGREVNMETFIAEVSEISALGRSNDILKAIRAEVVVIQEKMNTMNPEVIAQNVATEFRANLESVNLSQYMRDWVATSASRDQELVELRRSLLTMTEQLQSHIV